jgi:multicomponent Na+:H+ antiporter subunit D
MNNLLVLPFVLPLLSALLLLSIGKASRRRRGINLLSLAVHVAVCLLLGFETFSEGPQALSVGLWKAPLGIALCVDKMSALFLVAASVTTFLSVAFGYAETPATRSHPLRGPLIQFLLAGVSLAFITGDLFNLFVSFEVLLISSYALMTLEAENAAIRHAFPYLAINLFGSTLFVSATGLVYSLFGTLNFADLGVRSAAMAGDPRVAAIALLLVLVFGLKAGMFPLFYWLPDSYPMMPPALVALYSGLLTKVGIYALFRLLVTALPHSLDGVHQLLLWAAAPTMVLGVLGALSKNTVRSILSFHIVSQIGYMLLAIGLFSADATAACLLFAFHQVFAKASLFLIGGTAKTLNGSDRLDRMGNLWVHAPWLGALFLLQAFSLAGLPPLSGLWPKVMLLKASLDIGAWWLAAAILVSAFLVTLTLARTFLLAYWRPAPGGESEAVAATDWHSTLPIGLLAALTVFFGIYPEPLLAISQAAADGLADPSAYIRSVFPEGAAP